MGLLSIVVFLPVAGIALLFLAPGNKQLLHKAIIVAVTFVSLAVSILLISFFDNFQAGVLSPDSIQYLERLSWIPVFNIQYFIGIDGLNLIFVFLTTVIFCVLGIISVKDVKSLRGNWSLLFLLETCILGTFVALDLFLFFMFWTFSLIPIYFLIGFWGGDKREKASLNFILYNLAGAGFLLAGIIIIHYVSVPASFDLFTLISPSGYDVPLQKWVFGLFFAAIAIRLAAFPLHSWYVSVVKEAPLHVNIIIAALLTKTGFYALFRFSYTLFPEAAELYAVPLAVFGVFILVYYSLAALAQKELKLIIAYSSLSSMGFVLIGAAFFVHESFSGALMHAFVNGIIVCMLFIVADVIENRTGKSNREYEGIGVNRVPVFTFFLWLAVFGAFGVPGTGGFVSQILIIMGAFSKFPLIAAFLIAGLLVLIGGLLYSFRRIFESGDRTESPDAWNDLSPLEIVSFIPCGLLIIAIGVAPMTFLSLVDSSVKALISLLQ